MRSAGLVAFATRHGPVVVVVWDSGGPQAGACRGAAGGRGGFKGGCQKRLRAGGKSNENTPMKNKVLVPIRAADLD